MSKLFYFLNPLLQWLKTEVVKAQEVEPEPSQEDTFTIYVRLADYFHGKERRDLQIRDVEQREQVVLNAYDLIKRVNKLLTALNQIEPLPPIKISSGLRTEAGNKKAKGATRSHHLTGRALDLSDPTGKLGKLILANAELLADCGLWLEDPSFTPNWIHLDTGTRRERKVRVFNP